MASRPGYSAELVQLHGDDSVRKTLVVALRIAYRFKNKKPTVKQLVEQFGMHRSTAYRWITAWQYVRDTDQTST